jgi:hypothetical protein
MAWMGVATSPEERTLDPTSRTCGYWAFVPIFREVCGTRVFGIDCSTKTKTQTVDNFCGLEVQKAPGFSPWGLQNQLAGEITFVETDCATYVPSDSWKFQGTHDVSLAASLQDDYTRFWLETSKAGARSTNTTHTSCELARGTPMAHDCIMVLSGLTMKGMSVTNVDPDHRYLPSNATSLNGTEAYNSVRISIPLHGIFMFTC